LYEAVIVPFFG